MDDTCVLLVAIVTLASASLFDLAGGDAGPSFVTSSVLKIMGSPTLATMIGLSWSWARCRFQVGWAAVGPLKHGIKPMESSTFYIILHCAVQLQLLRLRTVQTHASAPISKNDDKRYPPYCICSPPMPLQDILIDISNASIRTNVNSSKRENAENYYQRKKKKKLKHLICTVC